MHKLSGKSTYDVLAERNRQLTAEGYSEAHDDKHISGQIAMGAAAYLAASTGHFAQANSMWPWEHRYFKSHGDERDLVKAGAMVLAELDRINRLKDKEKANGAS